MLKTPTHPCMSSLSTYIKKTFIPPYSQALIPAREKESKSNERKSSSIHKKDYPWVISLGGGTKKEGEKAVPSPSSVIPFTAFSLDWRNSSLWLPRQWVSSCGCGERSFRVKACSHTERGVQGLPGTSQTHPVWCHRCQISCIRREEAAIGSYLYKDRPMGRKSELHLNVGEKK